MFCSLSHALKRQCCQQTVADMAQNIVSSTLKKSIHCLRINQSSWRALILTREMSQYPQYFINPIYKREAQEELRKSGELQKLVHVPTRAPLNDQTSSQTQDELINLFINYVMKDGLKILARGLVAKSFENIKRIQLEKFHKCQDKDEQEKIELDPKTIFHQAVENCKPILNLTPIKRGGVRYQVPVPITPKKSQFLSMKWLIAAAKEKDSNIRFHYQLALELIDAANNKGRVVKRKQELHRQCEANRAYAHYRWS